MLIDAHCHLDLFHDPIAIVHTYENTPATCVLTTMLPSHYLSALPHLKRYKYILPAIGLHPLRAKEGLNEIALFADNVITTEYIGEIGLDLSGEGVKTKDIQNNVLKKILPMIGLNKYVSIHSRNAHEEIFTLLEEFNIGPVCFHYFTGGPAVAEKLAAKGHYFSVNHRMLKHERSNIINYISSDRILVESDGPFLTKRPLFMIEQVYNELSKVWKIDISETEKQVIKNFRMCRTKA